MFARKAPASRAVHDRLAVSTTGAYPRARHSSWAARHSWRTLPVMWVSTLSRLLGVSTASRARISPVRVSPYFSATALACSSVLESG